MTYQTTTEAGDRTGLNSSYIRRLASTGRIAGATKIGKTWLIPQTWEPPQLKRGNPNWRKDMFDNLKDAIAYAKSNYWVQPVQFSPRSPSGIEEQNAGP